MLSYIVYQTRNNNRKVTVINGQPYYQSTGHNSDLPEVWLPFLMIVGNRQVQLKDSLKEQYNCEEINNIVTQLTSNYIVKFEQDLLNVENECPSIANGRFPTKETLITSLRLRSLISNAESVLTEEEFNASKKYIEFDEKESEDIITDPDQINDWLRRQGATFINTVLTNIPRIPPELVMEQERLEVAYSKNNLEYLRRYDWDFPYQYADSCHLIRKEINRIKDTTYDTSVLKYKKIVALLELQTSILSEIQHSNIYNEPLKSLDTIISDWKNSNSFSNEEINNYTLIAEHRRGGFLGFFNIGRTNSHIFIDTLSTKAFEGLSNCQPT